MARKNNTTNTTKSATTRARKSAHAYRHAGNRLAIDVAKGKCDLYLTREVLDAFKASPEYEDLARVALGQMPGHMFVRQRVWDAESRSFVLRTKADFVADVCRIASMFIDISDVDEAKKLDADFQKLVRKLVREGKLAK